MLLSLHPSLDGSRMPLRSFPPVAYRPAWTLGLVAALAVLGATTLRAQSTDLAPAPYRPPPPGTALVYTNGLTNRIVSHAGWSMRYTDAQGRPGALLALFIVDHPDKPLTVDVSRLRQLWPLRVDNLFEGDLKRGLEIWNVSLRVTAIEEVTVPAGTFLTYVVEGVQGPHRVADPASPTIATTWWYAPEVGAVVRFMTSTVRPTGVPAPARRYELVEVVKPTAAPATRP